MRWKIAVASVTLLVGACSSSDPVDEVSGRLPSVGNYGILQEDVTYRYRFQIHCGMEWLIGFNGTDWKTDEVIYNGSGRAPERLREFFVNPDEVISPELWTHVALVRPDEIHLTLPDGSESSTYYPTDEEWPGCA